MSDIALLRETFAHHGYTPEGVGALIGEPPRLGRGADRDVYLRRLGTGKLATLVKLFYLGVDVEVGAAEEALAPLALAELESLGLAAVDHDRVAPLGLIQPYEGLLLASDLDTDGLEPEDRVPGLALSPLILAWLTVRRPVECALDLGTGGGIHALLAARHAGAVVGVDINPRALAYAELNARVNGVENVEWRRGSWFEPVRGSRFDLIVANPPFVVSPESAVGYRDSGRPPNELVQELLAAIPEHLTEGGYACVICDCAQRCGEDWRRPLEAAIERRGCDAWLLRLDTVGPADYAARWNLRLRERDPHGFRRMLGRWLAWYSDRGIERIATAVVVLRRCSARPNRLNAIELPCAPRGPANDHVRRLFQAQDELRAHDPLAAPLRPAPGARLRRRLTHDGARFVTAGTVLERASGLPFAARLDDETAALVESLDGRRVARDERLRRLYELGLIEVKSSDPDDGDQR